jgi:hypothetical protein
MKSILVHALIVAGVIMAVNAANAAAGYPLSRLGVAA